MKKLINILLAVTLYVLASPWCFAYGLCIAKEFSGTKPMLSNAIVLVSTVFIPGCAVNVCIMPE